MFYLNKCVQKLHRIMDQDRTTAASPAKDTIADYLKSWGLEMYIEKFNEHSIDIETLQMLSDADLKELVPVIGHRAKLSAQIKLLTEIMSNAFKSTPTYSFDSVNTDDPNIIYTLEDFTNVSQPSATEVIEPDINSYELYNTLCGSNEGKGILLQYQNKGLLNNTARRRLCQIIINEELKNDPEKKISSARFYQIAYEISQIFKQESSSIYFIPYASYSPLQKISAKGKLLDQYRQRRRDYIKSGLIKIKEKRCVSSSSNYSEPNSPCTNTCAPEALSQLEDCNDNEEKLLWLENSCSPWETVELYWQLTTKKRLNLLASNQITIDEYFSKYKALKLSGGIYLILRDFNVMFPDSGNKFNENWLLIRPKIIDLAKNKKLVTEVEDDSEEGQDLAALTALPFLMTTANVTSKKLSKKQQWRPSKQEVSEGFITHLRNPDEIKTTIINRRDKLQRMDLQLQPFILVVGPSKNTINARYVIINDTHYEVTSVVQAVDACLKAIFVLNAEYPRECQHVWQFIQRVIFKIKTKYDKSFTSVNTLMTDLCIKDE